MFRLILFCVFAVLFFYKITLQIVEYRSAKNPTPENVSDVYDAETYLKWKRYNADHAKLSLVFTVISSAISFVLLYLAIVKQFEPLLLMPIAFGMLLTNLPLAGIMDEPIYEIISNPVYHGKAGVPIYNGETLVGYQYVKQNGGLLYYLYQGVKLGIFGKLANEVTNELKIAKDDPMCRGLVFWPELSHGDPFVIEYFAANAWDKETLTIAEQTERYCRDRYPTALVEDMGTRPLQDSGYDVHDRDRYAGGCKTEDTRMCRQVQYPESEGGTGQ